MTSSNRLFFRGLGGIQLHCPFCGQKCFPDEEYDMPGDRACEHLLADQSEGIIWYASDTFLRVADDILGLPEEAFEETIDYFQNAVLETDKGGVDSDFMMKAVTSALKEKGFNVVGFDIDGSSDFVHQLFLAEEIPDDVKFRPIQSWELPGF